MTSKKSHSSVPSLMEPREGSMLPSRKCSTPFNGVLSDFSGTPTNCIPRVPLQNEDSRLLHTIVIVNEIYLIYFYSDSLHSS